MGTRAALAVVAVIVGATVIGNAPVRGQAPRGSAPFTVAIDGTSVRFPVFSWFVMPAAHVSIRVTDGQAGVAFALTAGDGTVTRTSDRRWMWHAPAQPGAYHLDISGTPPDRDSPNRVTLHVFVMRPATEIVGGRLNGYRIGSYPSTLFRSLEAYRAPRGFIEVTPENQHTPVSPRFRIGQFLCKQEDGFPKYLVLRPTLLFKLEAAVDELHAAGIRTDGLHVMSGYRTPFYNHAIGNGANSRHIYGDAADVFVDVRPVDGQMDDLDGDDRVTDADTQILYDLVDGMTRRGPFQRLIGGLGRYRATAAHGPFVHVDARGYRARW